MGNGLANKVRLASLHLVSVLTAFHLSRFNPSESVLQVLILVASLNKY